MDGSSPANPGGTMGQSSADDGRYIGGGLMPPQPLPSPVVRPMPNLPGTAGPAPRSMRESKNWLDRTREETASNLFERLVKDAAKKKVI